MRKLYITADHWRNRGIQKSFYPTVGGPRTNISGRISPGEGSHRKRNDMRDRRALSSAHNPNYVSRTTLGYRCLTGPLPFCFTFFCHISLSGKCALSRATRLMVGSNVRTSKPKTPEEERERWLGKKKGKRRKRKRRKPYFDRLGTPDVKEGNNPRIYWTTNRFTSRAPHSPEKANIDCSISNTPFRHRTRKRVTFSTLLTRLSG